MIFLGRQILTDMNNSETTIGMKVIPRKKTSFTFVFKKINKSVLRKRKYKPSSFRLTDYFIKNPIKRST